MRPALAEERHVVLDRFTPLHLGLPVLRRRNEPPPSASAGCLFSQRRRGGVAPDLVFILDLPAKEAMARVTRRDGAAKTAYEKRGVAWLERVRKGFLAAAKEQEAARKAGRRTRYVVLDARQSQEALRDEVRRVVSQRLGL